MVRLMLVLAPVACILSGISVSTVLTTYMKVIITELFTVSCVIKCCRCAIVFCTYFSCGLSRVQVLTGRVHSCRLPDILQSLLYFREIKILPPSWIMKVREGWRELKIPLRSDVTPQAHSAFKMAI